MVCACVRADVHEYIKCVQVCLCVGMAYAACMCLRIYTYRKLSYVQYPVTVLLYTTP